MTAPELTDETAFSALVERHRRELQVHCYRMLGSLEEAEDLTQETFLRAWRARETYAGRASLRAWLYRIATNACLDALERGRTHAPTDSGEVLWLQPYPGRAAGAIPADADEPDAEVVARETIELAFMVAIQHLPPRPRAVLILRDVLGWRARDTAELLDDQRRLGQQRTAARAGGPEGASAGAPQRVGRADGSAADRALVATLHGGLARRATRRRWRRSWPRTSASRCRRSRACTSGGTRSSASGSRAGFGDPERSASSAASLTRANRQPAVANYAQAARRGRVRADGARRPDHRGRRDHGDHRVPARRSPPSGCRRRCDVRGAGRRRRPGDERAYDEAEWRDAIVLVQRGRDRAARRVRRLRARFGRGDLIWLEGVPLRALHNPGARARGAASRIVARQYAGGVRAELAAAHAAVDEAVAVLRAGRDEPLTRIGKAAKDFLTEVDLASEAAIKRSLAASTPEIGFYGEEGGGAELRPRPGVGRRPAGRHDQLRDRLAAVRRDARAARGRRARPGRDRPAVPRRARGQRRGGRRRRARRGDRRHGRRVPPRRPADGRVPGLGSEVHRRALRFRCVGAASVLWTWLAGGADPGHVPRAQQPVRRGRRATRSRAPRAPW